MIHIKYCKKCNGAYDIETNYDICPACRFKEKIKEGENANKKRD